VARLKGVNHLLGYLIEDLGELLVFFSGEVVLVLASDYVVLLHATRITMPAAPRL
jgi:hypothetical protein